jgi:hypothetical protein
MSKTHTTGKPGKSQTTESQKREAIAQMNTGQMSHVGRTGAGDRDDKVMDSSNVVWGVHQQPGTGGGVRQAYPMHRAKVIPSTNQYGGFSGSFTFDPDQRAENSKVAFEGRKTRTIDT